MARKTKKEKQITSTKISDFYLNQIKENDKATAKMQKEQNAFFASEAKKIKSKTLELEKTIQLLNLEQSKNIEEVNSNPIEVQCVEDLLIPEIEHSTEVVDYDKRISDEITRYEAIKSENLKRMHEQKTIYDEKLISLDQDAKNKVKSILDKLPIMYEEYLKKSKSMLEGQGSRRIMIDNYLYNYLRKEQIVLKNTTEEMKKELAIIEAYKGPKYNDRAKYLRQAIDAQMDLWKKNTANEKAFCEKERGGIVVDISKDVEILRSKYLKDVFALLINKEEILANTKLEEHLTLNEMMDVKKHKEVLAITLEEKHISNLEKINAQKNITRLISDEKKRAKETLVVLMHKKNEEQKKLYQENNLKTSYNSIDLAKKDIICKSKIKLENLNFDYKIVESEINLHLNEKQLEIVKNIMLEKNNILNQKNLFESPITNQESKDEEYLKYLENINELKQYQKDVLLSMADYAEKNEIYELKAYFEEACVSLDGDYYIALDALEEQYKEIKDLENDLLISESIKLNQIFNFIDKNKEANEAKINEYYIQRKALITAKYLEENENLRQNHNGIIDVLEKEFLLEKQKIEQTCLISDEKVLEKRDAIIREFNAYKDQFINIDTYIERRRNDIINEQSKITDKKIKDLENICSKKRDEYKEFKQQLIKENKEMKELTINRINNFKSSLLKLFLIYVKKEKFEPLWWNEIKVG